MDRELRNYILGWGWGVLMGASSLYLIQCTYLHEVNDWFLTAVVIELLGIFVFCLNVFVY